MNCASSGTEGQRTSENPDGFYSLGSSYFIFGMGYKWAASDFVSLGVETTFRSTGTDYL
ncbi:MAG: hypothetical protein U5L96_07345 [Owenweeksia sp.]|nr:hypothetical protein [Owenweeksia sp.]